MGTASPQQSSVSHYGAVSHAALLGQKLAEHGLVHPRIRSLRSAVEGQGELRAKARRQAQGVTPLHRPTGMEGQVGELRVRVVQVRYGGHGFGPESRHHGGVLDARRHGVAGVAFGVHHQHLAHVRSKGAP